jgi:hypothetical protein
MKKFINPLDPDDLNIRAAIRQWTIDFLKLEASTELEIIEHLCTEANCLHTETVIKVENTEGSLFYKIAKPLTYIRKLDVQSMTKINAATSAHRH